MSAIDAILRELDEQYIAGEIGIPHDEARLSYRLDRNTVADYREFERIIADYYNHHFTTCVSHGGRLTATEAAGRAKEILDAEYKRRGGNVNNAYNDAHDGTEGGLRGILDMLADHLKAEAVERHMRQVFDRYVTPVSWEEKVEIMRQFLARVGRDLSPQVRVDRPDQYAGDWQELVRAYVEALRRASSVFRRL